MAACTTRSCRAASGSPRRRATASRSPSTIPAHAARARTASWPARWQRVASSPSRGQRPFGLGRGLDALIPGRDDDRGVLEIALHRIDRNPDQPRHAFDDAQLGELAASIAVHGVLQPVIVRELADGGYQLIAGERRVRAARLAGLETIPAVVRDTPGAETSLELALIENLQREDLNA